MADNEPNIDVLPLTSERWNDLETIFGSKGCSVARGCWCMYYRKSGRQPAPPDGCTVSERNRDELRALAEGSKPPGLVGYQNEIPVGWISLGPREDFAKLRRSSVMKPVDAHSVWSIICFVVPSIYRGQGLSRALLKGAIDYAKTAGATILEAYPVDKAGRSRDDSMFFGSKSIYDSAGFKEVARRKPTRPVVRLLLAEQKPSSSIGLTYGHRERKPHTSGIQTKIGS